VTGNRATRLGVVGIDDGGRGGFAALDPRVERDAPNGRAGSRHADDQ